VIQDESYLRMSIAYILLNPVKAGIVSDFDRRRRDYGESMKRLNDRFFEPVEKIIWEFEHRIGHKIEDIAIDTWAGVPFWPGTFFPPPW